jgi:hypothetical protein
MEQEEQVRTKNDKKCTKNHEKYEFKGNPDDSDR